MHCATCGLENRADRKFCAQCGAALAVTCPTCGASNLPGERFCGECGQALGPALSAAAPAAPAVPAAPVAPSGPLGRADSAAAGVTGPEPEPGSGGRPAERRLVSILFADLVGFTTLSENRDAEETRELLETYFAAARAVVVRYGGTIEKFIGDAVMAVWGIPTVHEDDAERAVRAGLELIDAVAGLRDRTRISDLAARAAVLTGEAAVTIAARDQALVAGDLVNSAARLQGVAAPGTVLVGAATERSARDAIVFEPAGDHAVKGKSLPLAAWRAMRVVAGRRGVGRSDRLEAPFVGRSAEIRALKDALSAAGQERRARYVAITGQAGIGKSRLAWELEKYVDGLVEPVYWHRGRSPAYGEGIAFWALAEMVRSRAGILETDSPTESTGKLAAVLATHLLDGEDRRWVEPHLRVLLGLDQAVGGDRNEQFAAWRRFFEAISDRGTVALVFEDLQWADDGVLDFIDSLFDWSRNHPILVVVLARSELVERRPTLGTGSRNVVALHLEPLAAAEMRELLNGLAPDLSPAISTAVVARAEGIPLYAIELVRMLRDGEADVRAVDSARLAIPPSLQALVAARLDGLAAPERSLLQDAAVIGQSFTIPALAAVSGNDAASLEPILRALVRREFLSVEADPRSPERGQYAFVQSVIHETAYGTLARRDRRARHLAAARHLDSLDDESMATVLATHYLEAYRAAPDDDQGRAIRGQARVALRAAADRSARLHNYEQAIRDLERALELTESTAETAAIYVQQAELSEMAARLDDAAAIAERARLAYVELDDRPRELQATALLGRIEMKRGRITEAVALFERSLADLEPSADPEIYARFAAEYARTHMVSGRHLEGASWADRALAAAGPIRLVEVIAEALDTRGVCLQGLDRLDEGVALIRASVDLAAANHLSSAELRARFNLAGRRYSDDPRDAIAILRSAVDLALRTGRRDWLIAATGFLAGTLTSQLELAEALAVVDSIADEDRPPEDRAGALFTRSEIAAYRGDHPAWERGIAEANAMIAGTSNDQRRWGWAAAASEVAIAEGRLADAIREAELIGGNWAVWKEVQVGRAALRAGDLAGVRAALTSTGLRSEVGVVFDIERAGLEAGILGLEGRPDACIASYREVIRRARELGVPALAAAHATDAVHVIGPDDPEVNAFGAEARAFYERVGAQAYLGRLEAALRRSTNADARVRSQAPTSQPSPA